MNGANAPANLERFLFFQIHLFLLKHVIELYL